MPYRFAHWLILMLIVLTVPAFWRSYLSDLSSSRIELHVHGVTASIWMALLAIQSWSIHNRHRRLHRTLGKASFVLFPFFLVGFVKEHKAAPTAAKGAVSTLLHLNALEPRNGIDHLTRRCINVVVAAQIARVVIRYLFSVFSSELQPAAGYKLVQEFCNVDHLEIHHE